MLTLHFLNVGHGDCTIIRHPSGRLSMIDINNGRQFDKETYRELREESEQKKAIADSAQSLSVLGRLFFEENYIEEAAKRELADPIQFLKDKYPNEPLFRFILTHPDIDHMRGLKALFENVEVLNFWDTNHLKAAPDIAKASAEDKDWLFYKEIREGDSGVKVLRYVQGQSGFAFNKDATGLGSGDNIEILSPSPEILKKCKNAGQYNNASIILRIQHGSRSVILPGDAESQTWSHLKDTFGTALKSSFLKASHHGRETGFHLEAFQAIDPSLVVVSVGRKPNTDASRKYKRPSNKVVSTRYFGNITLTIRDDGSSNIELQYNNDKY